MRSAAGIPGRLRRSERALLPATLAIAALAGWGWLFYQVWGMQHMDVVAMAMPSAAAWHLSDLLLVFVMWAVMMAAMMLPSAMPMVLLYGRIDAGRNPGGHGLPRAWVFVLGYLAVWMIFSLLATLLQWGLHAAALTSPRVVATPTVGGMLLLAAGLYQWTPFKHACLAQCRTPLGFLLHRWRDDTRGTFTLGLRHGGYCVGCCWMLMLLVFVLGMMNLAWIALLSLVVLVEKIAPGGAHVARAFGVAFVLWGGLLLY